MSEVKTWQHRINDADFHATREELMQAEINELRAHISALESQEPIGEVSGSDWSTALLWKDREPGSPVYAEAGAAPVQQEQASFPTKDAELWLTKNKLATHGVLGAAPAAKVPEDAP